MVRRIGLTLALVALLTSTVLSGGCADKNLTPETPKAATALKADAVVVRVNELQAALIEACGPDAQCRPDSLDTNLFRTLISGCIDLRTVLRATPEGWRETVRASWAQTKPKFAGITNPAIVAALGLVDAAIGGL